MKPLSPLRRRSEINKSLQEMGEGNFRNGTSHESSEDETEVSFYLSTFFFPIIASEVDFVVTCFKTSIRSEQQRVQIKIYTL